MNIKLLQEWLDYSPVPDYKVLRVYRKCLKSGRNSLAARIKEKYPNSFKIKDDRVMSFALTLEFCKNNDR